MDNQLFTYSPITERPPITWPGGARVAFYVGLNIEHYRVRPRILHRYAQLQGVPGIRLCPQAA